MLFRSADNTKMVMHTITPGETLHSLARRYGTTVADIARLNRITDVSRLRFGDRIVIPARG